MKPNLLWDLDGTLTSPHVGILRCVQHALRETGRPVPPEEELLWVIGPPLHESFARLAPEASKEGVWELVAKYRERFGMVGLLENEVYSGIPELLTSLKHKTHYLATSKPHIYARRILEHFQLAPHFAAIHGSELDGTRAVKGELIRYILETEGIKAQDALIVGDREHDILGAKEAGIMAIGVTWGYGSRDELERAGADAIFDTPSALSAALKCRAVENS